jgi:hypothetical protein
VKLTILIIFSGLGVLYALFSWVCGLDGSKCIHH